MKPRGRAGPAAAGRGPEGPRIVLTGGPGAGKTSVLRTFAAAHPERVMVVPEVATQLLSGLFPEIASEAARCAVQTAIYHTQCALEATLAEAQTPGQTLLCDRGTPDGAGYWPAGPQAFFATHGTSAAQELARYTAVVFLESAAGGGLSIAEGNPARREDEATAVAVDRRLRQVWQAHPRFHFVPLAPDFTIKVAQAVELLDRLV